jgi:lipopolysaccharide export system protein LptA
MAKGKRNYTIVNTKTHTHIAIPKKANDSSTVQAPGRKVVVKRNGRAHRFHHYNYYKKKATGKQITYRSTEKI